MNIWNKLHLLVSTIKINWYFNSNYWGHWNKFMKLVYKTVYNQCKRDEGIVLNTYSTYSHFYIRGNVNVNEV